MPALTIRTAGLALALFAGTAASAQAADPAPDLGNVTLRVGIFHEVVKASVDATDFLKNTLYKLT